jgi:helix-turn-helix protein
MKTLDQIISGLPAERRAKIAARTDELVAEEKALRSLRKARHFTQERMAELLHIGQDSVSRIESRSDLLLSTLKSYVEAMGGSLQLVVEFPDGFAELASIGEPKEPCVPRTPAGSATASIASAVPVALASPPRVTASACVTAPPASTTPVALGPVFPIGTTTDAPAHLNAGSGTLVNVAGRPSTLEATGANWTLCDAYTQARPNGWVPTPVLCYTDQPGLPYGVSLERGASARLPSQDWGASPTTRTRRA